ncbi:MAG: hypothetical protein ACTHJJ_17400 [Intrasporangium sp.]|uniref:hypothetical protein n=1 Tax=Intrasporangium sp. TaxID=1925024 RepID=UPI003F7D0B0E
MGTAPSRLRGWAAWRLFSLADHIARLAHMVSPEVPDLPDLTANAFDLGLRISAPLERRSSATDNDERGQL